MITLRDYQIQALEAERRHRETEPAETRLAIVLPTGTGKAITLAERALRFMTQAGGNGRVLILVHTDELVSQLKATVRLIVAGHRVYADVLTVGVVKADRDETHADIIVASVQTLARPERRARIADVGLVIVDECHHAAATSYLEILRHFGCYGQEEIKPDPPVADRWSAMIPSPHPMSNCGPLSFPLPPGRSCPTCGTVPASPVATPALGFTATLERGDGAGLGGVWQDVAFTRDISWAVRKGYLVQPIGYRLEIPVDGLADERPERQDALMADSIAPELIVKKWLELASDRVTVAYMPLVRSAQVLAQAFRDAGVAATWVAGDDHMPQTERRRIIADWRAGHYQVVVNASVLIEGFDYPKIKCVIPHATKSRQRMTQEAGRGLRPVPGIPVEDQDCILITLADATTDLCSIADLSDRLTDRKADGALTAMEDEYDIGRGLEDAARHWTGKVDATRFDPIVAARSKVWARTKGGYWFLPISKDREYVFLMDDPDGNTDIYVLTRDAFGENGRVGRTHSGLPDRELAFSLAEDEAAERGGDVGALLADRTRAWRKQVPKPGSPMLAYASRLGLDGEVQRIMSAPAGGKAGKVSDLIRRVEASRSIDKAVQRIKERQTA